MTLISTRIFRGLGKILAPKTLLLAGGIARVVGSLTITPIQRKPPKRRGPGGAEYARLLHICGSEVKSRIALRIGWLMRLVVPRIHSV